MNRFDARRRRAARQTGRALRGLRPPPTRAEPADHPASTLPAPPGAARTPTCATCLGASRNFSGTRGRGQPLPLSRQLLQVGSEAVTSPADSPGRARMLTAARPRCGSLAAGRAKACSERQILELGARPAPSGLCPEIADPLDVAGPAPMACSCSPLARQRQAPRTAAGSPAASPARGSTSLRRQRRRDHA